MFLRRATLLLGVALLFSGCIGNGLLQQDFSCQGKATVVGSGSGFSGLNGTIDCGPGFTFNSGTKGAQTIINIPVPQPPTVTQGVPK